MDEQGEISKMPDMDLMNREIYSTSITDVETKATIKKAWKKYKLLLEPHGAVGWCGLERYMEKRGSDLVKEQLCVSLETAHPAKFPEQIREILQFDPELPKSLEGLEDLEEQYDILPNEYQAFKEYLINKY
jgi:threonine synthase